MLVIQYYSMIYVGTIFFKGNIYKSTTRIKPNWTDRHVQNTFQKQTFYKTEAFLWKNLNHGFISVSIKPFAVINSERLLGYVYK